MNFVNEGDLKRVIAKETGLEPNVQNLLFRGKEKDDGELLHMAGLKDNAKVVVMENSADEEMNHEEVEASSELSRGSEAVAEVRQQIDKLAEQVAALEAVVCTGTQVADKDFVFVTEMLMRQLLKLDGIDAEGEGKVQRKLEVRRVQSLVETMDNLKARNSNPFGSAEPVTARCDPAVAPANGQPSLPSSTQSDSRMGSF